MALEKKMASHRPEPLMKKQRGEKTIGYQSKLEKRKFTLTKWTNKNYYRAQRRDDRSGGKGI
jgi:hypothetical protein